MQSPPDFKPHMRAVPVGDEGVLLLSELGARALRGKAKAQVAALIDGRRSAEQIVQSLSGVLDPALAWAELMRFESDGYLGEAAKDGPAIQSPSAKDGTRLPPSPSGAEGCFQATRHEAAFWLTLGLDSAATARAAPPIRVVGAASSSLKLAEQLCGALRRFNIDAATIDPQGAVDSMPEDAGLDVVLVDDYLSEALPELALAAQAGRRRWLLARPVGTEIWIGPLFDAGGDNPACLNCLQRRLRHLRPAHRLAACHDAARGTYVPLGATAGSTELACLVIATEVAKSLFGSPSTLVGAVQTLSLRDWSSESHRLLPHPACRACGDGSVPQSPSPLRLQPRAVTFDADGGYRAMSPHETLRNFGHLVSPLTGIVNALRPDSGAPEVGRTWVAGDIAPIEPTKMAHLAASFRSSSIGKGMTDAQAKAGALCEAIEHYSAQRQGVERTQSGTYRALAPQAIHPNAVMNFSEAQYRNRVEWNAKHPSPFHLVPQPLSPDDSTDWTPLWSLSEGRHKLLPTSLLYYDRGEKPGEDAVCIGCSNGCAAGNTLEEAVLQGLLELIERDAVAIWWYNRLRRPALDLESFADPWLCGVQGRYRELNRGMATLDLTTDLGIPVVAAISHRLRQTEERIAIGFGCHLDARIAAQRALTELCQMQNLDLCGDAAAMNALGGGWMRWARRAEHPYLVPDETAAAKRQEDFPDRNCRDLLDGIEVCRKAVEAQGMELLALDQTRADTTLPVVKVVVPGLRHFWPRFAPGRLYEVPVAMGWLSAPRAESALNPVPFFF